MMQIIQKRSGTTWDEVWSRAEQPRLEIRIHLGIHEGNVVIPKGFESIRFRGYGQAGTNTLRKIVATDPTQAAMKGLGVHNIEIDGLTIEGGKNGVQIGQSGTDTRRADLYSSDISIHDCHIFGQSKDGIKISQTDRCEVFNNRVHDCGDQGIDFVAVNTGRIVNNEVFNVTGTSGGIFAKGGSKQIHICGNHVHDIRVDGIVVGGQTDDKWFRPGEDGYEIIHAICSDNLIERVGKRPINILGAVDSTVLENILRSPPADQNWYQIQVGAAKKGRISRNVQILNNGFSRRDGMVGNSGQNTKIEGNYVGERSLAQAVVGPR